MKSKGSEFTRTPRHLRLGLLGLAEQRKGRNPSHGMEMLALISGADTAAAVASILIPHRVPQADS